MSNTNKVYVISRYYCNGEAWEDNYNDEKPIKVFNSLTSAKTYCESMGEKIENTTLYGSQITKYNIVKTKEYSKCPIGKDFKTCDYDYEEEYCDECYGRNHDVFYDNSFEELKIYEVETGD